MRRYPESTGHAALKDREVAGGSRPSCNEQNHEPAEGVQSTPPVSGSGAPVVPVGLIGTEKLQPAGKKWVKPRPFTMAVGRPLYFSKTGPQHALPERRRVTDQVMDAVAELSGQERSAAYNQNKPDGA